MDYIKFYNLTEQPFSNAPDSRFFFENPPHHKTLVKLMHAAERMTGLGVVLGDIGTGKTMLSRRLLETLPEEQYEVGLMVIIHSEISPYWVISKIAQLAGVEPIPEGKPELISALYRRLMEIHEAGKKMVIIIDEAQMFKSQEVMEEMRGLLNMETSGTLLITFLMFGLPNLDERLALDPPLAERVAMKHRLTAFDSEVTTNYVKHRLEVVGRKEELFKPEALDLVFKYSKGKPRTINTICDNALLEGCLDKKKVIDKGVIEGVAQDLGLSA